MMTRRERMAVIRKITDALWRLKEARALMIREGVPTGSYEIAINTVRKQLDYVAQVGVE